MKLDLEPRIESGPSFMFSLKAIFRLIANAVNRNDDAVQLGPWILAALTGIASDTGTITTKSGSIRYRKQGRTVTFTLAISITTNGTGAGQLIATLPYPAAAETIFAGQEVLATGVATTGYVDANSATLYIIKYDATYSGGNGTRNVVSGTYETTS